METNDFIGFLDKFRTDMTAKIAHIKNIVNKEEGTLKSLKKVESSLTIEIESQSDEIKTLENELACLDAEKDAQLAKEGVTGKLQAWHSEIDKLRENRSKEFVLPECPVCLLKCDPKSERHVYSCPEGHSLCGQCAPRVVKCPVCRMDKANFGGVFTRNRELEKLAGTTIAEHDQVDMLIKISRIMITMEPVETRKVEVEAQFDKKKASPSKKLAEAREKLAKKERGLTMVQEQQNSSRQLLESLMLNIKTTLLQTDYDPDHVWSLNCHCQLRCSHPLRLALDGRLRTKCQCVETRRQKCSCVTHVITMEIAIEGGSSGEIKIHLAGRNHPRSVNRFFNLARTNWYADTMFHHVHHLYLQAGKFNIDESVKSCSSKGVETILDAADRNILTFSRHSVGIHDREGSDLSACFAIFDEEYNSSDYRKVGQVVEGTSLVDEAFRVGTKNKVLDGNDYYDFPNKVISIKKSRGWVANDDITL